MPCLGRNPGLEHLVYLRQENYYQGINMVTKSECEHDIGFYRAISGDGGDIVEECSKCGKRVATIGPKTLFKQEKDGKERLIEVVQPETADVKAVKEEKKQERKEKREAKEEEEKPITKKVEKKFEEVKKAFKREEPKKYARKYDY
jgi:hypothetical protein